MQLADGDLGLLGLLQRHGLGQLHLDALRRHPDPLQRGQHLLHELRAAELRRRHVDRHHQLRQSLGVPGAQLQRRMLQHPQIDGHDGAALLGDRDEFRRRDQPPLRMAPAQQGLGPGQCTAVQCALRLEDQEQLAVRGGVLEARGQLQRAARVRLHLGREKAQRVAPVLLGAVHRHLGRRGQGARRLGIVREYRHAGRGAGHQRMPLQAHRRLQQGQRGLHHQRHGRLVRAGHDGHIHVAGIARQWHLRAQAVAQAVGLLHQQLVAGRVAQAFVDQLELVQVEPQQRQPLVLGRAAFDGLGQLFLERLLVAQPGQGVEVRQRADAFLGLAAPADVLLVRHVVRHLAEGVADGVERGALGVGLAVLAAVDQLALPGLALGQLVPHLGIGAARRQPGLQQARVAAQHLLGAVAADLGEGAVDVQDAGLGVGHHHRRGALVQCLGQAVDDGLLAPLHDALPDGVGQGLQGLHVLFAVALGLVAHRQQHAHPPALHHRQAGTALHQGGVAALAGPHHGAALAQHLLPGQGLGQGLLVQALWDQRHGQVRPLLIGPRKQQQRHGAVAQAPGMLHAAAQKIAFQLVAIVVLQVQQGGIQKGLGHQVLLVVHGIRDIARQHQVGGWLPGGRRLLGHGQLEVAQPVGLGQADALAAGHALGLGLLQRRQAGGRGLGRQDLGHRPAQQLLVRGRQPVGIVGMHLQVHPAAVHFEQQVGQGFQRGALARFGLLQPQIGLAHGFDEQPAVQETVGDDLVQVPRQVVDIGHIGVQREEVLANPQDERRQRQVDAPGLARALGHEAQPRHEVGQHQRIFQLDLEGRQPAAGHEGARNDLWMDQQQVVHSPDDAAHGQQAEVTPPPVQPATPALGPQRRPQQRRCGHGPRRQPEVDGLFRAAGGDEVRHAGVRQGVRQIQQRHAQQADAQHQGAAVEAVFLRDPGNAEDHGRHGDRQHLHDGVQRQVAGQSARRIGRRQDPHQQQPGQQGQQPVRRFAKLPVVGHGCNFLQTCRNAP